MDSLLQHPQLGSLLAAPSVSYGSANLYVRGVLEEHTRPNLSRTITDLVDFAGVPVVTVNDKKLSAPLRVRLKMAAESADMQQ